MNRAFQNNTSIFTKPNELKKILFSGIVLAASLNLIAQGTQEVVQEEYRAWVLNTDFNLPAIRFNTYRTKYKESSGSLGRLSVFNSVGAGISLNHGHFTELHDANDPSKILNSHMRNQFGLHKGMLFSYPNDSTKNFVFAPTVGIQLLDIQFGTGYELGTIQHGESRIFYTLAYRIPIKKLYNLSYIRMKKKAKQAKRS